MHSGDHRRRVGLWWGGGITVVMAVIAIVFAGGCGGGSCHRCHLGRWQLLSPSFTVGG